MRTRDWKWMGLGLGWWALAGLSVVSMAAAQTDAEIEECLSTGKITGGDEVLFGLTKPLKVTVLCEGWEQKAAFKYLSVTKQGLYVLADGQREFNFTDRYHYERAAYLLDRELGLGMVPVAALRTFQRKDGVVVAWISDAVNGKRISTELPGTTVASLERQKSVMRMFDSLIYNVDRRPENYLINESTGKLYMIDHSQSFRIKPKLQDAFAESRIWMPEDLYIQLKALEKQRLSELTRGLISSGQVKALLKRRDLILEKIDQDLQEYGNESVFLSTTR